MTLSSPSHSPPSLVWKSKRFLWIAIGSILIVVIVVVALVVGSGVFSSKRSYFDFTSFNETLVYMSNGGGAQTNVTSLPVLVGKWAEVGVPFTIDPYYVNNSPTNYYVTSVVSNTTGFTVTQVSPPLPVQLPNSSLGNVTLYITFNAPSTTYSGPFDFSVYLFPY